MAETEAVKLFQKFLRIRTISGEGVNGSYAEAVSFLKAQCDEMGLQTNVFEFVENKPVLVATCLGSEPELPSVLLNSHFDVVPVDVKFWNYDPFGAVINDKDEIVGRGAQDMKCVCIQYLEAMKLLKTKQLKRTIHLSFVPDEEMSGADGMQKLLADPFFATLNVGVALDEGIASETDKFTVFYGERAIQWLKVRATGPTGHASRLPDVTAMQNLITTINNFLAFRASQVALLHGHETHGCSHSVAKKLGDVVSLNLTMLQGGVSVDGGKTYALNVIPTEAVAGFDMRIPVHIDLEDFENNCIKKWTNIDGVSYEFLQKRPEHSVSCIDSSSFWWNCLSNAFKELNYSIEPEIFPAATDSRFIRGLKIPAFGFSPMRHEKILLHDHDERIKVSTFLEGIDIYVKLIPYLANA